MIPIDRNPLHLYPKFRDTVNGFITTWNGTHAVEAVGIFEGLRSFERQAELYAIGRTTDGAPCIHAGVLRPLGSCAQHPHGRIVTNAPPGMSWHQYGLAADVVFDSNPVKPDLQASWDGKYPWKALGIAGTTAGLEWAGSWRSMPEFPHFQKTYGLQLVEAHELYQQGGLPAVWKALG